jgi:C4-dicarboxylate-specific signal transduction histidine kinase
VREVADDGDRRRDRMRSELARLRRHVGHIEHIVSRQQEHARGSSMVNDVGVDGLIEQAFDLVQESLARRGVRVERPPTTAIDVRVDPHQSLQILVNLLTNARDAVERTTAPSIYVTVTPEAHQVRLEVTDNGCGFDEKVRSRLFQHGFTTKPHGHGFGLHHSILLARAMGGDLCADSHGPGLGATFTVVLPRVGAAAHRSDTSAVAA